MAEVDNPGWMDIFNQYWEVRTKEMWTAFPGKCIKYDSALRQASIEVGVKYLFGEDTVPQKIPNLLDVPVLMPGNQFATINLPKLGSGSLGLIIVANVDITDWILGGGQAVLPTEDRRWDINDGFFVPGVFPVAAPYLGTIDDDVLDINVVPGIKARLGSSTADIFNLLNDNLTDVITALKFLRDTITFSNGGGPTGPPSNGATLSPTITALEATQTLLGTVKS